MLTARPRKPKAPDTYRMFLVFVLAVACSTTSLVAQQLNQAAAHSNLHRSQAAVDALQKWYEPTSGLYNTTGWWNSANAITALADFSRVSGSREYLPVFANTLSAAQSSPAGAPGFLNKYYDDEGWWALAWIDVFDLTGDTHYLQAARDIFQDMQGGWETATCGGGVWWSKDKRDKNAIENELFLAVAASLANREPDELLRRQALDWAQKEWQWFQGTGMVNSDHLVNDGVDTSDPAHCTNNGKATWTYNQGVILGALVELNRTAPNPALLRIASSIADAAIDHLADAHGILHEPNDAHTGSDVPQFKGIFVRNLMFLNKVAPQARYHSFISANADALWQHDRDASNEFGFWWQGPVDGADASRQSSALDLLVAADSLIPTRRTGDVHPLQSSLPSQPNYVPHNSNVDIAYLGDSITYGGLLKRPDMESPPATATDWIRQTLPGEAVLFSNQGHSGHTTVDFLPTTGTDLPEAEHAATTMLALPPGTLIFSVMLGTNDSAESGPLGAPVSPRQYAENLTQIFTELLHQFPKAVIVVHRPTWYSANTHNGSDSEQPGLARLQSYFPAISLVVRAFAQTAPGHVYLGDTEAFAYFSTHYKAEMNPQSGVDGTFYLHPNTIGAEALGYYWASAIRKAIRSEVASEVLGGPGRNSHFITSGK